MAALALGLGGSLLGGSLFGSMGAQIGMLGASILGQFLFPQKKTENRMKLSDMKVSSSTYGKGIAKVWGTMRVSGNVFWAMDIEEREMSSGKKGAGMKKGEKPPEYYGNFAIGLCEGQVERILRVWADSNIIYDVLDPKRANKVGFQGNEEFRGYDPDRRTVTTGGKGGGKGQNMHSQAGSMFTFRTYLGTETQLPDPYMQQESGIDRTPAHRGLCYLFFEELPLEDFGNRLPSITVELVRKRTDNLLVEPFAFLNGYRDNNWWAPLASDAIYDPVNRTLMQIATTYDGTRIVDRAIRHFDVMNLTETTPSGGFDLFGRDLGLDEFGNYPSVYDSNLKAFYTLIGVNGQGHAVFTGGDGFYGAGNFRELLTYDPKTRSIRDRWGTATPVSGGDVLCWVDPKIFAPIRAQFVPQMEIKAGGMPKTYTCLQVFAFWEHSAYFETKKGSMGMLGYKMRHYEGSYMAGTVGKVDAERAETVAYYSTYDGYKSQVWKVSYDLSSIIFAPNNDLNCAVEAGMDVGGTFDRYANGHWYAGEAFDPEVQGVVTSQLHTFFYFQKTERLYALNSRNNYGGTGEGTWLVQFDEEGMVIMERKIAPYQMPSSVLKMHTDVIAGTRFAWVFQKEVFIFDDLTGTIHSRRLPDRVPIPTSWQFFDPLVEAVYFWSTGEGPSPPADPTWYAVYLDRSLRNGMTLEQIVREIAYDRGLRPEQLSTSELTDVVTGYMMEEPQTGRSLIEQLAKVFHFDVVESDYILKFPKRGKAIVRTITEDYMSAVVEETNDAYKETRTQDIDLPERVVISYIDPIRDYMTTTQHSKRTRSLMPTMQSRESIDVNLPMSLTAAQAKQMAEKVLFASWMERVGYAVKLSWQHLDLDPSDAVRFQMNNGWMFEVRFLSADLGADYSMEIEAVLQDGQSYFSDSPGTVVDKVGIGNTLPRPNVEVAIMDLPLLDDGDEESPNAPVIYNFALAQAQGFRPGPIYRWIATDRQPEQSSFHEHDSPWGILLDELSAPTKGHLAIDETASIRFRPGPLDYDWETIDDLGFLAGENAVLIDRELIYFRDVTVAPDGIVTVSCLLRGQRGTEVFGFDHKIGAEVIIVDRARKTDTITLSDVKREGSFMFGGPKAIYRQASNIETVTFEGNSLKPLPVTALEWRTLEDGADTLFDYRWKRRSRMGGTIADGDDEPPFVDPEDYDFFILRNTGTIPVFNPDDASTYAYTVKLTTPFTRLRVTTLDQIAGLDLALPYTVVIYQRSLVIGRGFAATFAVDPPPERGTLYEDPEYVAPPVTPIEDWGTA